MNQLDPVIGDDIAGLVMMARHVGDGAAGIERRAGEAGIVAAIRDEELLAIVVAANHLLAVARVMIDARDIQRRRMADAQLRAANAVGSAAPPTLAELITALEQAIDSDDIRGEIRMLLDKIAPK